MSEAPTAGSLAQFTAGGVDFCLANHEGRLAAVDNWCPHRHGPLSEGWLEDGKVVCPWHAWAFDLATGECAEERSCVPVFPLQEQGDDVLVQIG